MKLINALAKLALGIAAVSPLALHATTYTYDAVSNFSIANGNPNGVWSYGSGNPSAVSIFQFHGTDFANAYGFDFWAGTSDPASLPAVGQGETPGGFGTVNVPDNELWMHPGPNAGEDSLVLFTAAQTGEYTLNSSFTRRDTSNGSGNGTLVGVYLNGSLLSNQTLATIYGTTFTYDTRIFLNAGDVLAFDLNSRGAYNNDSTGLKANLSVDTTPEPSSIALLGTGLLGVAGFARRRFKK